MTNYERVARIVQYLDSHSEDQPSFSDAANEVGLSEKDLQQMLIDWGCVNPKEFLPYLRSSYIKKLLKDSDSETKTELSNGSTRPHRMPGLCVTLEAASSGYLESTGKGWQIVFGFAETPFGKSIIAECPRGICYLAFVDQDLTGSIGELQQSWPEARLMHDDQAAAHWAVRIFQPMSVQQGMTIRAYVKGTPFQVKVWNALLRIPPNSLTTYGRLAAAIGQPTAARAVGSAVGENLVSYLIPCHRVVRETGKIGGYRWGTLRKRIMIGWESVVWRS